MAIAGYLTYSTEIDQSGFDKGIKNISSSINNMIPSASSALSGLSSAFNSIGNICTNVGKVCSTVTGAVSGVFVAAATKAYSFIETYESAMAVFEKRLGKTGATDMYNQLLDIAKGSKFAQEYLVSAGQTLVGMGIDADNTAKYVQVATDAISAMGGTGADVESLSEMFAKMSMQTTLYTNDLNQMLRNGIPVYDILAKKYDTSTDAIKKMASAGELTSTDFEYLMEVLNGNVDGMEEFSLEGMALAAKTGTLSGAVDSLNSSFRTFALNLLDLDPRTESGEENINGLCQVVETLGAILEDLGDKFSFVGEWLKDFVSKIATVTTTVDEDGNTVKEYGGILGKFKDVLDSLDTETLEKIASGIGKIAVAGPTLLVAGKAFNTLGSACSGLSTASKTVESFGSKVKGVFSNISDGAGMVSKVLSEGLGFGALAGLALVALGLLEDNFGDSINNIIQTATENGPEIITNLINGITEKIPDLIAKGGELLQLLLECLVSNLPSIVEGGASILTSLIEGIAFELPSLIPMVLEVILTLVTSLLDNVDELISAGMLLLMGLAEGIINCIPTLISYVPTVITSLIQAFINLLPQIISCGITLLVNLATGLISALPQLLAMLPQIIGAIINAFKNNDWASTGQQILKGIIGGFTNVGNIITTAVKKVGNQIMGGIKSFFGIESPSKLMRDEVGEYLPAGIAVGVEANTDEALDAIDDMNEEIMDEMNKAVYAETGSIEANAITKSNNSLPVGANNVDNSKTTEINNVQNFYSTQETPYEEQIEAKRQLRRLAYDLS